MYEEETHEKQFRGCFLPAEVMKMVEDGKINCKEAILLMTINSLCKPGVNDCYASNKYLGNKIHTKEDAVRRMIKHLKELRLVTQTGFNGRRRSLITAWSHLHKIADPEKLTTQTPKNLPRRPRKTSGAIKEFEKGVKETNCRNKDSDGVSSDSSSFFSGNKKPLHPRWNKRTKQLYDAISINRQLPPLKLTQWSRSLEKIHRLDKVTIPRFTKVFEWYCKKIGDEGDLITENSKYIPIAYSGRAFREKFLRIEDAMNKPPQRRSKEDIEKNGNYVIELVCDGEEAE